MKLRLTEIIFSLICLLQLGVSNAALAVGATNNVYVSGFVRDEKGTGLDGVDVILEHENRKIASLRTIRDGWFEASEAIAVPKDGMQVRIILIKPGYKFTSTFETLKNSNYSFDLELQALPDSYLSRIYEDYQKNTLLLHGRVQDPLDNNEPLAGAKLSLFIKNRLVDIAFSKDNGYFTFELEEKYKGKQINVTVEHPKYELIQLAQEDLTPIFIPNSKYKKRQFEIDWLIRESLVVPTSESISGYSPIKFEINFIKATKFILRDGYPESYRALEQSGFFNWSLSVGSQNTSKSDLSILQVGRSWKPFSNVEGSEIVMDFAGGIARVENNKEETHDVSPHFQLGISKYNPSYERISSTTFHYRLEFAAFRENGKTKFNIAIGFGI